MGLNETRRIRGAIIQDNGQRQIIRMILMHMNLYRSHRGKVHENEKERRRVKRDASAKMALGGERQTKKPVTPMMDAFMNDPTEPRTSLLLLPSSFSYFIFTFLDRP